MTGSGQGGRLEGGRLEGATILVVGAGTQTHGLDDPPVGNGRAIAVAAAREGARLVLADRDEPSVEATAALVREEGGDAAVVVGDVTDEAACAAMVAAAEGVTGVVCNVGIGRGRGLAHTTAEDWDAAFAVNLRAHFLIAQAAVPVLPEGGSIVFVGSVAGLQPGSRIPAYDASKAGLIGLNRHVALEAARRGVRGNVLAPGLIDTPLGRLASAGRPGRAATPVPLGRQGTAWEVAAAAVFLLSTESSYVTGQTLVVDGGLSLL